MPLQTKGILELAQKSGGKIITVEDNYTGGLDAEIAMAIADGGRGGETAKPGGCTESPRAAASRTTCWIIWA